MICIYIYYVCMAKNNSWVNQYIIYIFQKQIVYTQCTLKIICQAFRDSPAAQPHLVIPSLATMQNFRYFGTHKIRWVFLATKNHHVQKIWKAFPLVLRPHLRVKCVYRFTNLEQKSGN